MGCRLHSVLFLCLATIICLKLQESPVQALDYDHFSSKYGAQCYNCHQHSSRRYQCNTPKGLDYCSPAPNRDYLGRVCKRSHPCGLHGRSYTWCNTVDGNWGFCGWIEPKVVSHISSHYGLVCEDECARTKGTDYFWCHTMKGWDYCSPLPDVTRNNARCNANHPCDLHGYSYYWCRTGSTWAYCGPVEKSECHFDKAHDITCEKTNRGKRVKTRFRAEPRTNLADAGPYYEEALEIVAHWDKGFLRRRPTSSIYSTARLRLDFQGFVQKYRVRYYLYQIQIKTRRQLWQSSSIAQVMIPVKEHVPRRYVRTAFTQSLALRARVRVIVNRCPLQAERQATISPLDTDPLRIGNTSYLNDTHSLREGPSPLKEGGDLSNTSP